MGRELVRVCPRNILRDIGQRCIRRPARFPSYEPPATLAVDAATRTRKPREREIPICWLTERGKRLSVALGRLGASSDQSEMSKTRDGRQVWSLSNRHQGLVHGVAKSLQPSPLDHRFCNAVKYRNPRQSGAGMMIRNPIAVLHFVAYAPTLPDRNCDGSDSVGKIRNLLRRFTTPVDVGCRSMRRERSGAVVPSTAQFKLRPAFPHVRIDRAEP